MSTNKFALSKGFTIVEMLVIAPIVLLAIGAFITAIVSMTGEVLSTRAANSLAYNIQDALGRIEADVKLSTTFLATNSIDLTTPQGFNNDTTDFKNAGADGDMLILNALVTTGNPQSDTSGVVYLDDKPNDCAVSPSSRLSQNTPMTMNIVYFVKNNTLWRRVIMPADYASAGCNTPWQQPSCAPGQAGAFCKTQDIKLVDDISTSDFTVDYYSSADSTSVNQIASDSGATDSSRANALLTSPTVGISIDITKQVAGREINQSGSIRVTKLDTNASTLAPVIPEIIPPAPTVTAKINPSAPATAVFSWNSVPGATSYNVNYNNDAGGSGTYVTGVTGTQATSYSVQGEHGRTICATVYAVSSVGTSPFGSKCITTPIWGTFTMENQWVNYGSAYAGAGFTKTTSGVVMLRGLIRRAVGDPVANEYITTLPEGYRPSQVLMFGVSTASVSGRVDIYPNGRVVVNVGYSSWLSLDNISFIPDGRYSRVAASPLSNGWTNYGGSWGTPSYVVDNVGRVYFQGLVVPGTITNGTVIYSIPQSLLPPLYMHVASRSSGFAYVGYEHRVGVAATGLVAKNSGSGYVSMSSHYYKAGSGTWSNLSMQNGWVWYGGASSIYSSPQYTKAADGLVTIKGLIGSGTTTLQTNMAILPAGYRPGYRLLLTTVSNGAWCRVDISAAGEIQVMQGCSNVWLSLDGISFYAEN